MKFTRTFRRSGLFVLLGVVLCILAANGIAKSALLPLGVILLVFSVPVFAISATRHLLRGILWRVGSRLFVSYVLLTLPVFLIVGVAFTGLVALTGQIAARRVEAAFLKRTAALGDMAHDLLAGLPRAGDAASRKELFLAAAREKESDLPKPGAAWILNGRPPETAGEVPAPDLLPRGWIAPGRRTVIARLGKTLFLAAIESGPGGTLVLVLPLGREFRQSMERETGAAVLSVQGATVSVGKDQRKGLVSLGTKKTSGVSISDGENSTNIQVDAPKAPDETTPAPAAPSAPPEAWGLFSSRWVAFPLLIPQPVLVWETGIAAPKQQVLLLVRSSIALEYRELFGHLQTGSGHRAGTGDVVMVVMGLLSVLAGLAYVLATLIAGVLVLRIARATRRLSAGFTEIEKGNFGARAQLAGGDQLGELIASFNRMGAHLSASVTERAEKEAIEHELVVARDLQRRLLPPPDFSFPGFEIAVDFRPAAVIGGDFYDLVAEKGKLTVVVADVSGHGLPTGIVMAAAKASLSALARSGATGAPLLTQLDEEILRTTDSRTFVTLAHLEFRVDDGTVVFTNAGHLYPYRVTRDGAVSALENPARPLGLALPATFRTVTAPLVPGDLWIVLSDGIIEATAKGSDEEFGFVRLEAALARSAGMSAETVKEQILSAWRTFTRGDEPEDDRTLVVLRVRDESPGATFSA